jgi:hypothetical protein
LIILRSLQASNLLRPISFPLVDASLRFTKLLLIELDSILLLLDDRFLNVDVVFSLLNLLFQTSLPSQSEA